MKVEVVEEMTTASSTLVPRIGEIACRWCRWRCTTG
jgi:hypothetical protein